MATWPSKFKILRDSFTEGLPDRVISSNMDVGPAKKRRRTILASYNVNMTALVKMSDVDDFRQFYLTNDAAVFDFMHPRTNQIVQARFASVPSLTLNETYYTASVELEIMP
ncbi:MAG: hypothetical protein J6W96_01650 [Alphaproteobacteria bacterium]|nr:hypothetical protein [Alphaproteobacteria bacterium]